VTDGIAVMVEVGGGAVAVVNGIGVEAGAGASGSIRYRNNKRPPPIANNKTPAMIRNGRERRTR
jgi:hypothetical protein